MPFTTAGPPTVSTPSPFCVRFKIRLGRPSMPDQPNQQGRQTILSDFQQVGWLLRTDACRRPISQGKSRVMLVQGGQPGLCTTSTRTVAAGVGGFFVVGGVRMPGARVRRLCGGGSPRRRSVGPRLGEPRLRWAPSRRAATTLGLVSESRDYVGPRLGEPRLHAKRGKGAVEKVTLSTLSSYEQIPKLVRSIIRLSHQWSCMVVRQHGTYRIDANRTLDSAVNDERPRCRFVRFGVRTTLRSSRDGWETNERHYSSRPRECH